MNTGRTWRLRLRGAVAAVLLLGWTTGSTAAGVVPAPAEPTPDDGLDDAPALQHAIDALWRQGGGTLRLPAGEFDLAASLRLRSGVTLEGVGRDTHLNGRRLNARKGWGGVVVFAGNMGPVNYSDVNGGYGGRSTVRAGRDALEIPDCEERPAPAVGTVIWTSGDPAASGRRGAPHSPHDEMNLIVSADGCTLRLSLPITAPAEEGLAMHASDGSALGPDRLPQSPIKDAVLRDLSLGSENSQALIVSGCFRCVVERVHIRRSRRLLPVQGSRGSRFENISGEFTERGIEFAAFATENTVKNVTGAYVPVEGLTPRPAIRFGEYARNNSLSEVRLMLGPAYRGRTKIRFDESMKNRLETIQLLVPGADDPARAVVYRGPGADRASRVDRPPETTLVDVSLCFTGPGAGPCRALR